MARRVVVTGMGLVTPFGCGLEKNWSDLLAGKSCISTVQSVDLSGLSAKVGGEIKWKDSVDGGWFDPSLFMEKKSVNRVAKFIVYALCSADEALKSSGVVITDENRNRIGVIAGSGIGGMDVIEKTIISNVTVNPARVSPFFIPAVLTNLASGQISIAHGICGPNFAVSTACASGNNAIGEAYKMITSNAADIMLATGAESAMCLTGFSGFCALRALSDSLDPITASRPYDLERNGFVMSEGSATLVLEEYESAKARGANILAEIIGYGLSSDGHHITAPHPEGDGAILSMKMAINMAKINPEDISYINAHGTSTPLGDELEIRALHKLFGESIKKIPVSSTKSSTGHMLGAAGAVEAIFSIMAIRDSIVPATTNLRNLDPNCGGVNLVPLIPQQHEVRYAMSNGFGFGGCNATIIFAKV